MKAAFEHARKLVHATDLQQAIQIQSEFLRSQFTNAGEHMRQITGGVMSAAKNTSKASPDARAPVTFAKINSSTSCVALPNAGVVQARLPN